MINLDLDLDPIMKAKMFVFYMLKTRFSKMYMPPIYIQYTYI